MKQFNFCKRDLTDEGELTPGIINSQEISSRKLSRKPVQNSQENCFKLKTLVQLPKLITQKVYNQISFCKRDLTEEGELAPGIVTTQEIDQETCHNWPGKHYF